MKDGPFSKHIGVSIIIRSFATIHQVLKERKREYSMKLRGKKTTAAQVYNSLVRSIANVYRDIMEQGVVDSDAHPNEFKLFNNPHRVIDGPCYAFLVHGKGPAVGGQGFLMSVNESSVSESVDIRNNQIENVSPFTYMWFSSMLCAFIRIKNYCVYDEPLMPHRFNASPTKFQHLSSTILFK